MIGESLVRDCDLVILHRLPYWPGIEPVIKRLQSVGKPVLFDADDLVFSEDAASVVPGFRNCTPSDRYDFLDRIRSMAATLRICTGAIVSTDSLQLAVSRVAPELPVWVNRNAVSNIMVAQATSLIATRRRNGVQPVRLGYFSGTYTHNADFCVCSRAIANILRCYPEARLIVAGRVELPAVLLSLLDRVQFFPFVPWRELPALLQEADINLAPLEMHNKFTNCKSELKYLEAGLLEIPTIASSVGGYVNAITNGMNGFLCESTSGWEAALSALIEKPELRESVGKRARQNVLAEHVTWVRRDSLERILAEAFAHSHRLATKSEESRHQHKGEQL